MGVGPGKKPRACTFQNAGQGLQSLPSRSQGQLECSSHGFGSGYFFATRLIAETQCLHNSLGPDGLFFNLFIIYAGETEKTETERKRRELER